MANLPLMKHNQALEDLRRNLPGTDLGLCRMLIHVPAEIAMLDVFHGNMNCVGILKPPQERDEQIRMLAALASQYSSWSSVRTSLSSINASSSRVFSCALPITFTARRSPEPVSRCSHTSPNAPEPRLRSEIQVVRTSIRRWRAPKSDRKVRCVTVLSPNSDSSW